QAFTYELYEVLGIFIPLIVTNCIILGRADAFACKNPILPSVVDGFMMALGFGLVLVLLGAMREILGQGVIFSDMQLLFGPAAAYRVVGRVDDCLVVFFDILAPGAFMAMGLIIALKNIIDDQLNQPALARQQPVTAGSKRVRVTGKIS